MEPLLHGVPLREAVLQLTSAHPLVVCLLKSMSGLPLPHRCPPFQETSCSQVWEPKSRAGLFQEVSPAAQILAVQLQAVVHRQAVVRHQEVAQPKSKNQKKVEVKVSPLPKNPVVQHPRNPLPPNPLAAKNPAGRKRRSNEGGYGEKTGLKPVLGMASADFLCGSFLRFL